jgi:hypothetical protein
VLISCVLNNVCFSFPYLDCIMRWIDLFVVGGVISNKLYHAVDKLVQFHA